MLILVLIAGSIVVVIRYIMRKRFRINHAFGTAILKILLPKEGSEQKEKDQKKQLTKKIY